jgi:hypothetical protein
MSDLTTEQKLYLNKRIAYTALMIQEYAYREILDSPLIRENDRYLVKRKFNYVTSQINKINKSSKATKKQIQEGEDIVLENISLVASIMASLAIMPSSQVDFIEEEFTKICVKAVANEEELIKSKI